MRFDLCLPDAARQTPAGTTATPPTVSVDLPPVPTGLHGCVIALREPRTAPLVAQMTRALAQSPAGARGVRWQRVTVPHDGDSDRSAPRRRRRADDPGGDRAGVAWLVAGEFVYGSDAYHDALESIVGRGLTRGVALQRSGRLVVLSTRTGAALALGAGRSRSASPLSMPRASSEHDAAEGDAAGADDGAGAEDAEGVDFVLL